MKNLKIIGVIVCSIFFMAMSCEEDDEMDDRLEVDVLVRLFNYDVDCNDQTITYLIETESTQRSINVVLEGEEQTTFRARVGEFINVKAFYTNDPTNTELAVANIETRESPNNPEGRFIVRIHYDNCDPLHRILWTFEFD